MCDHCLPQPSPGKPCQCGLWDRSQHLCLPRVSHLYMSCYYSRQTVSRGVLKAPGGSKGNREPALGGGALMVLSPLVYLARPRVRKPSTLLCSQEHIGGNFTSSSSHRMRDEQSGLTQPALQTRKVKPREMNGSETSLELEIKSHCSFYFQAPCPKSALLASHRGGKGKRKGRDGEYE